MREGRLVFIADSPRGLACGCVCACCGRPLIAKKGSIRRHHFSHREITNCRGAPESVLHLLAKELLAELNVLMIPPYEFARQLKTKAGTLVQHRAIVAKGGLVRVDSVKVEEREDGFVPDILIKSGAKSLVIEVAVSNKVKRSKLRRIRKRDLPAIEIRLDPSASFRPRDWLKTKLQWELISKVWLFHPDQREAERTFLFKRREAIARDRTRSSTSYQIAGTRVSTPLLAVRRSGLEPPLYEYDRTAEEFYRRHGRYPTSEECLKLWPHLYEKQQP